MIKSLVVIASLQYAAVFCSDTHIVDVNTDFSKLQHDEKLSEYVSEILERLKLFKVPIHPRIKLFFQLLKKGMATYADRTSDTIFVPYKYNIQNKEPSQTTPSA